MYGLQLTPPKIVMTKLGEQTVRSAPATPEFWEAWKADKATVKAAGFAVKKDDSGEWIVSQWAQTMTKEERHVNGAASRAQDADVAIPLPSGQALLPYQKAGVQYALGRDGTLIADEMGLGKTVQAIAVANSTAAKRILVVCPSSLRINWSREIARFQTLGLPIHVIRAGARWPSGDGWFIVNYDIINRYDSHTKAAAWDCLVLDECHYLKNSKAKRTKAILGGKGATAIPATRKILLTGTPILNRPIELFTLINYLDPVRWGSWFGYAKRYCAAFKHRYGWDVSGASNLDELQARLRESIMVRRLKKDVLTELPPKIRQVIALEPEDDETRNLIERERMRHDELEKAAQRASYDAQVAEMDGDEAGYNAAVKRLHDIQQAKFTEMARLRHEVALAKVPAVLEHLSNVSDGKVIVFAHHRDVVERLADGLKEHGVVTLTGATALDDRQAAVDAFQADPSVRFFIGNIKAGGVGWTLTASSHVVFAELDWTPGWVKQSEDRAHRLGQRNSVLVQHIVLDGSLDARMAQMLVDKQAVADRALDNETTVDLSPDAPVFEQIEPKKAKAAPAITLTEDQVQAIRAALRTVAAMDSDNARFQNDVGFNAADTMFGCELAARSSLTPRQAAAAYKLIRKYKRQYDESLFTRIYGETA